MEGLMWPGGVSNFSLEVLCGFVSASEFSGGRGEVAEHQGLGCNHTVASF